MTDVQLLLWMTGIHIVGFICVGILMLPALRDDGPPSDTEDGSSDDGWGNRPNVKPDPGRWPGGGIPLPDAEQSSTRLRGPGRLSDRHRVPQRRPVRHPQPSRTPVRTRTH
jgi:hypothetical protein